MKLLENIKFLTTLKNEVKKYYKLFPLLTLKGEHWEHVLYNALINCGFKPKWKAGGHQSGMDIMVEGEDISCKGGTYQNTQFKNGRFPSLKFSGCRLTKHNNLRERLKYLNEKREDYYFCFPRLKTGEHQLVVFPYDILKYNELEWDKTFNKKTKAFSGWKGEGKNIRANIVKSCSYQVWTSIATNLLAEPIKI